jgi:hypothetical protein
VPPRVAKYCSTRWWVLTAFRRKGLATCDHPVCVVPNKEHLATGLGTGIENAETIHLPLTLGIPWRWRCGPPWLTNVRVAEDRQQAGVAATALYSNSCTVNNARHMLFHHPEDAPFKGLDLPTRQTREIGNALIRRDSCRTRIAKRSSMLACSHPRLSKNNPYECS